MIGCFFFITRRRKLDEQVLAEQHNEQPSNLQNNNIIHISHENIESMYNNRNEIVMDNSRTTIQNDGKECTDVRKEEETTIVSKLDDIGEV